MLRQCDKLKGYRLGATDGEIGKIQDFYFEDEHWTVRYLVADTGYWLPDRLVLITPHALREVDDAERVLHTTLTRDQIEESPPITADQPVSRQYEREYYRYYGWPTYWGGPDLWGPGPYPLAFAPMPSEPVSDPATPPEGSDGIDPHLRSVEEMIGYRLHARDGEIGHVEDLLLDDQSWRIRYLVIDTRNWLPGKKVLIAPPWIEQITWESTTVSVDLLRSRIQSAPAYDHNAPMTRGYEIELFKHYSREGYWPEQTES